jgi:phosphate:Na+ symporter
LFLIGEAADPLRNVTGRGGPPRLNTAAWRARGALLTPGLFSRLSATLAWSLLAASYVFTLPAGIAVMLGAELGTCLIPLLATLGQPAGACSTVSPAV